VAIILLIINLIPDGNYEICKVCFWEDDLVQLADPTFEGGANKVSLNQAQKNYREFGACEREMIPHVRKAYPEELSGIDRGDSIAIQ